MEVTMFPYMFSRSTTNGQYYSSNPVNGVSRFLHRLVSVFIYRVIVLTFVLQMLLSDFKTLRTAFSLVDSIFYDMSEIFDFS